jgi:orotidine-5'-phosphate decarboxylase
MTSYNFIDSVLEACRQKKTLLVAGFDPRLETIPDIFGQGDVRKLSPDGITDLLDNFFELFLDAVKNYVCAVKPNSAFFEQYGLAGMLALAKLLQRCREENIDTILDVKRGDIGSTAEAYARAYLGRMSKTEPTSSDDFLSGAITVNPFLGMDSLEPFISAAKTNGKGLFVLLRTSNPGAADFQGFGDGSVAGSVTKKLANLLQENEQHLRSGSYSGLGVVVGATCSEHFQSLRIMLPRSLFLTPGVGAQGGNPEALRLLLDQEGLGILCPVSRELLVESKSCSRASDFRGQVQSKVRSLAGLCFNFT